MKSSQIRCVLNSALKTTLWLLYSESEFAPSSVYFDKVQRDYDVVLDPAPFYSVRVAQGRELTLGR